MSNLKNQLEVAMPGRNVVLSENPFDSFSLIHSGLLKSEVEENAKYEEPDFLFELKGISLMHREICQMFKSEIVQASIEAVVVRGSASELPEGRSYWLQMSYSNVEGEDRGYSAEMFRFIEEYNHIPDDFFFVYVEIDFVEAMSLLEVYYWKASLRPPRDVNASGE